MSAETHRYPGSGFGLWKQVSILLCSVLCVWSWAAAAAPAVKPSITAQPQNRTATAGKTASFTVAVRGTAPFRYQWRRNGVPIAGATGKVYTTPATALADNGASFRVVISNRAGSATSKVATLTVKRVLAPKIRTQPQNQTVSAGQTATFTVVANGTAPLKYQWRLNGSRIDGATRASYTTPPTAIGDSGAVYSVVVSNAKGKTTSANATLTVGTNDGGGGTGARACFNPIFAVAGTRSSTEYLSTSPSSTYTTLDDQLVVGPTMFNGNAVNEHFSNTSFVYDDPAFNFSGETRSYFKVDTTNFRSFQYGSVSTAAGQTPTPDSTNINDPFVEIRFDLDVGQSHTTRFTSVRSSGPGPSVELTRTYLGRETVTVPAGSFEACKFATRQTVTPPAGSPIPGSSTTSELWYDVGSGFLLKVVYAINSGKSELVRGSINGTPIQ